MWAHTVSRPRRPPPSPCPLPLRRRGMWRWSFSTELAGGAAQRVLHEHGDGHGADAAGHGGNGAHPRGGGLEVHVARELARVQAVHPDVDDHRAFLDHVARDEARAARSHTENVRAAAMRREIAGARVAHGHGGIAREEELGERLAYEPR